MRASSYWTMGNRLVLAQSANEGSTSSTRTRRRVVPVSGVKCASTNGASAGVYTEQHIVTINRAADDVCAEQQTGTIAMNAILQFHSYRISQCGR